MKTLALIAFLFFKFIHQNSAATTPNELLQLLFPQTGACSTEHGRTCDGELEECKADGYFESNSDIPHLPSATGFMATHGTHRFLAMHEQTGLLVGEPKHGMWRFQENGFIRVYRERGSEGIPEAKKDVVLDLEEGKDTESNLLLDILDKNYKNTDPKQEFDYSFGDELSDEKWLNWIDLPIYHPKFKGKYDDHVPIDLPMYYCQLSSAQFPHIRHTWHLMKAQPEANKVGPLGKRAGVDIRENFNDVLKFNLFPDAGVWANVGQGNPVTDMMPKTLDDLKKRAQTVSYKRLDLEKMEAEVYIMERGYHNYPNTYLSIALVLDHKEDNKSTEFSYIRPDGKYYDGLTKRNHAIKNKVPNNFPHVYIEGHAEAKKIYGLATYGQHHIARLSHGLIGGGCPNKGGDVSTYPWGDAGGAWPVNYEEIGPICDAILVDVKAWTNLDKPWNEDHLLVGNSGTRYKKTEVVYQAHANHYGKYTDPFNAGKTNPYELDMTEDHKIQDAPANAIELKAKPVVNFTLDFGILGEVLEYNPVELDMELRGCLADKAKAASKKDEDEGLDTVAIVLVVLVVVLAVILIIVLTAFILQRGKGRNDRKKEDQAAHFENHSATRAKA